ncbi:hypothetical protein LUZ60_008404 [Juncus effusus]|nr:hypothetical protein LUZ60_008404 [Juncus effusus]
MTNSGNKVMPAIQTAQDGSKPVRNGTKITALQLAEILFTNPSDLFNVPANGITVNSATFSLITAFFTALNNLNNEKSSAHNDEPSLSFVSHVAGLTDCFIRPIDVLIPTFLSNPTVSKALQNVGIGTASVQKEFYKMLSKKAHQNPCKALRSYGRDFLLETARKKARTSGRDYSIVQLLKGLSLTKKSIILVGEPGVGKTAILEGFAQRLLHGKLLDGLMDKSIVSLNMKNLVSSVRNNPNMVYKRLVAIFKDLEGSNGKIILFVKDLHLIFREEISKNASILLKSMVKKQRVQFVGTATVKEYGEYFEGGEFNEGPIEKVVVEEPSRDDTIMILKDLKGGFENFHGIRILDKTLETVVHLSDQFIPDRRLPKKAIDLLDEACLKVNMETEGKPRSNSMKDIFRSKSMNLNEERPKEEEILSKKHKHKHKRSLSFLPCISCFGGQDFTMDNHIAPEIRNEEPEEPDNLIAAPTVDPQHVVEVMSQCTSIPISGVEREKSADLAKRLNKQVVGQEHVAKKLEAAIRDSGVSLGSRGKPVGAYLFVGGPGVGKTEMAKALAQELFHDYNALVSIDMSLYRSEQSLSRLIGNDLGYEGELTGPVRARSRSVVVLERIEMANVAIINKLNILFQNGILEDGQGRVVDFSNAVVIMTSNVNPSSCDQTHDFIMQKARSHFGSEFIDQIDEIMVFKPLSPEHVKQIVEFQISNLKTRLSQDAIDLNVSDAAFDIISQNSQSPGCGARPIGRWIEKNVVTKIVEIMLHGEENEAVSTIYIETCQGEKELVFRK